MRRTLLTVAAAALAAVALAATAAIAGTSSSGSDRHATAPHGMAMPSRATMSAADLRVTLDRLLGEHALLAVQATQLGYSGGKNFGAVAKALDKNSVELSQAIGLVFGKKAGTTFLNGKFLWRDHIRFFVNYTVALAKKDKAGQRKAVGSLMGYMEAFSAFLSKATGIPQSTLRAGLKVHVTQLKGALDAYAKGNYTRSATLTRQAYKHMIMTGDALSGAIAKKYPARFPA